MELLHEEFKLYLEALKKQGREIRFLRKNEKAVPVMTTIKKLGKFKNPKLLQDIFMECDINSLLYLFKDYGFNDYYLKPIDLKIFLETAAVSFEKLERWGKSNQ